MLHTGWLKLYRSDKGLAGTARERAVAAELGMPPRVLDVGAAPALEPVARAGVPPRHEASLRRSTNAASPTNECGIPTVAGSDRWYHTQVGRLLARMP
jgi:hypothetical protein